MKVIFSAAVLRLTSPRGACGDADGVAGLSEPSHALASLRNGAVCVTYPATCAHLANGWSRFARKGTSEVLKFISRFNLWFVVIW